MCTLMTAADPSPLASPYPTEELLLRHTAALSRELYRYHDCSGREVRDCIVLGHAERLMRVVRAHAQRVLTAGGQ